MLENLVIYPDSRLREVSSEVLEFGSCLNERLENMYETMIAKGGVGLAAVQVGRLERMLIVNIPREDGVQHKEDLLEVINPEILESSGEILFQEGCLSIPDYYEVVRRANCVTVRYFDREGREKTIAAEGYLAVALQHEIDHLNGILFIDKLPLLKKKKFQKEYKKPKAS